MGKRHWHVRGRPRAVGGPRGGSNPGQGAPGEDGGGGDDKLASDAGTWAEGPGQGGGGRQRGEPGGRKAARATEQSVAGRNLRRVVVLRCGSVRMRE